MPKGFAVGALQDGTQRIMFQLRDAVQKRGETERLWRRADRERRLEWERLAARSVEAFLKSGAAALSRKQEAEPPPNDSPFDESVPVREAAALPPPAGQPAATEYRCQKLIQERGRKLAAKRTEVPLYKRQRAR